MEIGHGFNTSKLSEVTNGDTLLTWLKANAKKQEEKTIGTFTHKYTGDLTSSTTYEFEVGMTWAEWAESEYNTASPIYIKTSGDVYWAGGSGIQPLYDGTVACKATDTIIDGKTYTSEYISSGGGVD